MSSIRGLVLCTIVGFWLYPAYATNVVANITACGVLLGLLPGKVFYCSSPQYQDSIASYFTLEEQELNPICVVIPASAQDVATIVKTMADFHDVGGQFAIRSGGHTTFAGAANIQDGVTIDLSSLNSVQVSSDQSIVQIGTGARWIQVYEVLDPLNITVTGGRDSTIGVGGFLTGGGISFLGPLLGWSCDNVVEYEVVLASGDIVQANPSSYPDLFLALKGGSNNFGVVTSFTLSSYPLADFWGGFIAYPSSDIPQKLTAFSTFMEPRNFDPHADMIESFGFTNPGGSLVVSLGLQYTKPEAYPPVFEPFVENSTALYSTMRISNMSDFVTEENKYQEPNQRQMYYTATFAHTPSIYSTIFSLWNQSIPTISNIPDVNWYMTFQPTPALNGTNSLGLNPADERLVIVLLTVFYPNATYDTLVNDTATRLLSQINQATIAAGVYRSFKYLNYAAPGENPIGGYGATSKAKLQATSEKYDPRGLFQTGVPGGFKLSG